jgi:hypothetical protein
MKAQTPHHFLKREWRVNSDKQTRKPVIKKDHVPGYGGVLMQEYQA